MPPNTIESEDLVKKYSSIINSNANLESTSLDLTVEDIVRDKTILDRIDVVPNPFESSENTRINYPPFEELFHSSSKRKYHYHQPPTPFSHLGQTLNSSKNSSLLSNSFNRSTHNDSSTHHHFRWSIDQIARLLPAEIEYKLQDDTLTIFRPHDEDTQQKIDEYFSNTVLPSPYTPDSKKISPVSILSRLDDFFSAEPSPTDLYLSHGTNGKFLQNKHLYNVAESTNLVPPTTLSEPNSSRSVKESRSHRSALKNKNLLEVSCQTDVSIHPDIDISKFLGEMLLVKSSDNSCNVLSSSSKLYESNETPRKYDITHDRTNHSHSAAANTLSSNKHSFYDIKFIQNSTANDVHEAFQQLDLSGSGSGSGIGPTSAATETTSKRKNLHVTFKDGSDHTLSSVNSLPNPLQNISSAISTTSSNNNNLGNDSYSLNTPPVAFRFFQPSHHDTPFVCNKKHPSQECQPSSPSTYASGSPRGDFHSSMVDQNNSNLHSTSHVRFNSNLSSPSWNVTVCNESYFNSVSKHKKGSPLADLDDLDKCFGSIDTSPIKPFYVFNSTTTDANEDGDDDTNNDDGSRERQTETTLKTTQPNLMRNSSAYNRRVENAQSADSGSTLESGYYSNAASLTTATSTNQNNKENETTTNICGHFHPDCRCNEFCSR